MEPLADAGENLPHCLDVNAVEDSPTILRREDQMGMKPKDTVAS